MSLGVVVDTDVVSYLFKNDTHAQLFQPILTNKILFLSFMTIAELERWVMVRKWGSKRQNALENYLKQFVVFESSKSLCCQWAAVSIEARQAGKPISPADAWIAATAIELGIPLVTNNLRHYAGLKSLHLLVPIK